MVEREKDELVYRAAALDGFAKRDAEIERLRAALRHFTDHFEVKAGQNKDSNQYGHLELWHRNPGLLLGDAQNSYSLACMGQMAGALEYARAILDHGE